MKEFEGKVAVVTGAGSGIGRGLAHAFAARGMSLAIADVEQEALDTVAAELRDRGTRVCAARLDVADRNAVGAFADAVHGELGGAHVLCNNAGVGAGGRVHELGLEAWDWILDVNLKAVVYGIHHFAPRMLACGEPCHIVNTASLAGLVAGPMMGAYNATKYAVVAITETMAAELAGTNVGVSVLCPAWVNTRINESERNKPATLDLGPQSEELASVSEELNAVLKAGLDPADVAERVIEAIEAESLYVLTHPDYMPMIEARFAAIMAAAPKT